MGGNHRDLHSFPSRRSVDLGGRVYLIWGGGWMDREGGQSSQERTPLDDYGGACLVGEGGGRRLRGEDE